MGSAPSTAWKETIGADEASRFAQYARQFSALQAEKSARQGSGRALHRKQLLGLAATFVVKDGLPDHCRQGLFAHPASYEAWVRLSNGGAGRSSDKRPDIRGFALAVLGVHGPGALGGPTDRQCFLFINHPASLFASLDDFVGIAVNGARGLAKLLGFLINNRGLLGGLKEAARLAKVLNRPFSGFATEPFYTAAPIAMGPYAGRLRLVPTRTTAKAQPSPHWAAQFRAHLAQGPVAYDVQVQFYTDDRATPIEDATVDWSESASPYTSVATLTVQPEAAEAAALADRIEASSIDLWQALEAHRPLGETNRARKVTYLSSQQARGAQ